MLTPTEKLIEDARNGERLPPADRRRCVAFLLSTDPETTNTGLGVMFGVSEGMIRQDIQKIREEKAKLIKSDDIGLILADIATTFERQIRDLERSKKTCETNKGLGTRTYIDHCKALAKLMEERVTLLQNLGYYPKNLGNMTVEKYSYEAIVTKDGSVDTRPSDMTFDAEPAIDAEFQDVPRIEAPKE